jgi:hypothetical protein
MFAGKKANINQKNIKFVNIPANMSSAVIPKPPLKLCISDISHGFFISKKPK